MDGITKTMTEMTDLSIKKMKVCVLGLGQVGLPTAMYIAGRNLSVWGYDISEQAVAKARSNNVKATTNWTELPSADVYILCVSTLQRNDVPDLMSIFNLCEKIKEKANSSLISIESTIIPGTCRKIYTNIFEQHIALIHVPHRYWAGDPIKYGVKQLRVFGAMDDISLRKGLDFYGGQLEIPLHIAASIEVAEMSKIAENAYRYVQIAFAEELRMICEGVQLNFKDVRRACNTKWNIEILEARNGINGHCLSKDTRYLKSLSSWKTLLSSAILVDNAYRKWLANKRNATIL